MIVSADLHIHSLFSMASSKKMLPTAILAASSLKGLQVIGTGDALHPQWRQYWDDAPSDDILVVPTTEVEDKNRVHHLILMPDMDSCKTLGSCLEGFSKNIKTNGRPHVRLSGEEIAQYVHENGGMIGPAHAFTPWTSLYAAWDCVRACYGDESIDLLELGLSADSGYGSSISELTRVPFLTNSDAHSPHPAKIGREFTMIKVRTCSVSSFFDAVQHGSITMNAGFFPEEGKYNRTACIRCYQLYTRTEAHEQGWRCRSCGGRIKKGVQDRAEELSDISPVPRPPYLHIIPLYDIIKIVLGVSSSQTKKGDQLYTRLTDTLGDEIGILTRLNCDEIRHVHERVGNAIDALRNGNVILHPGGGGRYGSFEIPVQ